MDQCNACMNKRCRTVERFRGKGKEPSYRIVQMLTQCTRRIVPTNMTAPLIQSAMVTNAQGVHTLLSRFNMSIVELDRKPWFKILIHKPKRRERWKAKHGKSNPDRKVKRYPR